MGPPAPKYLTRNDSRMPTHRPQIIPNQAHRRWNARDRELLVSDLRGSKAASVS
ncbi:hypothetical protein BD779DRAFT_1572464 [Infundibulicybe gibba]|nr:hypothetical protein BD779DRAFT_1572464 [Infundibulicybe gibba]